MSIDLTAADPPTSTPTTTPSGPSHALHRVRWWVAAAVLAGNVMDVLDSTIVNVAGPSIRRDLGGGATTLQWLSAGYTLAFAVLLITGARLGDIFGRRRLFLIGSAGFTVMSAACAAAQSPQMLIATRALQGGFGALMIPQGFGMLKEVFRDDEMPKLFSIFGPATGVPLLIAPVLAGALIAANLWGTGWRLVFLINVPIGVVALALAVRVLPRTVSHVGVKLDLGGMTLIGGALVAIIYPLIQGRASGWPLWTFALLAAGVVLIGAFVLYERGRRDRDPLIEPALLANRTYISGVAVALAFFGAFGGLLLCVSAFGQLGEGWSAIHAGLALTPMIVGMMVAMGLSAPLATKVGRHLLHVGLGFVATGAVTVAVVAGSQRTASTWDIVPGLFLIGMGAGFSFGQLFDFILAGVGPKEVGSASGVLEAVQQMATALGVAVLGTIFFSAFGHSLPTHALSVTAWWCLAPLAVAFGLVFLLPMHAREPGPEA